LAPRIEVALLRCGKCGKPAPLFGSHACNGRRSGRTRIQPTIGFGTCPACGKPRGNPLTHTCTVSTDFKARKRSAERKAATARKRAAAADKRKRGSERRKAQAAARRAKEAERRKLAIARVKAREAAKRKAAVERAKAQATAKATAPRQARPAHDYRTCTDDTCRRYACVAWKDAWQEGRTSGLDDGYDQGYEAGATGQARR
jgi:hypothetical protein